MSWKASTPRPVAATGTPDSSDPIGCQEYERSVSDATERIGAESDSMAARIAAQKVVNCRR